MRAFRSVGGEPLFYASAEGCHFTDADGRRFIDYVGSWGPLVLGHAHPEVVEAVTRAAAKGLSYGAPCVEEVELAELMVGAVPHLEMVRFVSSGTEAVMSAVRLARAVTGRDVVVKFEGLLPRPRRRPPGGRRLRSGHLRHAVLGRGAGGRGAPHGGPAPGRRGGPPRAHGGARRHRGGRAPGGIPPTRGSWCSAQEFVRAVREECTRHGALLLLDEVITGFRLGPAGAAARYGVTPDLTTYGKIIGGGLPVGAYGGARRIMERLAPLGDVYQAGTLSGNPVAMAAGAATLRRLLADGGAAYARLEATGKSLAAGIRKAFQRRDLPYSVVQVGSILWLVLQEGEPPRAYSGIEAATVQRYAALHGALLEHGVYLAPSAYEVMFASLAHDEAALAETTAAFDAALGALQ